MRRWLSALMFVLAWLAMSDLAQAERRIALVIGNGAYASVANLPNPPRDATAIGELFKAAGFDDVVVRTDLGNAAMRAELREFARGAVGADIAVVFYAGHGLEVGGHNYLIPVDAKLEYDTDVEDEAVDLDRVLQQLEPAKRLKLVILDACRENPFAPRMRSIASAREVGRGLAPLSRQGADTLVAYAAAVGATAADGSGVHSPFTSALLNHLTKPVDIRLALGGARDEVLRATNGKQVPFINGSLGGEMLSLAAPEPPPPPVIATPVPAPAPAPALDVRQVAFETAMRVDTIPALDGFLALFPQSSQADIVRRERDRLVAALPVKEPPPPVPTPTPTIDAQQGAFETAMQADTLGALDGYLARFPTGWRSQMIQRERQRLVLAALPPKEPTPTPTPTPLIDAQQRAFETAMQADTLGALDGYLARFPAGWRADMVHRERERLVVASLPPAQPAPTPAFSTASAPDARALAVSIEGELRRVGCYFGADADWGASPVKLAVAKYARFANLSPPPKAPDETLLDALKSRPDRVCPLECPARETAEGGRCVPKTCPAGDMLTGAGSCVARPAPPRPAPTREVTRAPPRELRHEAGKPAGGGGGHCFEFNGSRYCE